MVFRRIAPFTECISLRFWELRPPNLHYNTGGLKSEENFSRRVRVLDIDVWFSICNVWVWNIGRNMKKM